MGTRGRTCPTCALQWPQRDASFCGSCGALLGPADRAPPRRDTSAVATRLVAVMTAAGLVAAAMAADLPPRASDADVLVDAGDRTSQTPLSAAEAATLRLHSDPEALRCVPSGCELWRHHRPDVSASAGAVELGTGAIALLVAADPATATDATNRGADADVGRRLIALDPSSGDERWSRSLEELEAAGDRDGGVRLAADVDGGLLVVTRSAVVALDDAGERRWTWRTSIGDTGGISGATATREVVIVTRESRHGPFTRRALTALDPATGRVQWTEETRHVAALDTDLVIVVDGGRIRALDHASGATLWDVPAPDGRGSRVRLEGPWLVAQHTRALALIDPGSGLEVGRIDGWLTSALVPAGDRWIGTMRAPDPALDPSWLRVETGPMDLVALDLDGSHGWRTHLGTIRPWRECCPLEVDGATGAITVVDPVRVHVYDPDSGVLTDVRVTAREGVAASRNPGLSDTETWRPQPDLEVALHPEDGRVHVRAPDGDVVIRSGRTMGVASLDPIVVVDDDWVMGARIVDRR